MYCNAVEHDSHPCSAFSGGPNLLQAGSDYVTCLRARALVHSRVLINLKYPSFINRALEQAIYTQTFPPYFSVLIFQVFTISLYLSLSSVCFSSSQYPSDHLPFPSSPCLLCILTHHTRFTPILAIGLSVVL